MPLRSLRRASIVLLLAGCLPESDVRPGLAAYDLDADGLALQGYSPVSYVESGRAERGSPEFSLTHRGIKYVFTDAAQRDRFAANPERYEPAFGGWCAYGISHGIRWKPDPLEFEIVDGRLFLFSRSGDARARELWDRERDRSGLVSRAERYWESIREG